MSLASDYALAQSTLAVNTAATNAAIPPSFIGPNGRADVTPDGNLKLTQTGTGTFVLTPAQALAFAAWVTATFT
jgi:hypothetical protein